jgi:hypothetical protein
VLNQKVYRPIVDKLYSVLTGLDEAGVKDLAERCETTPLNLWKIARKLRRGDAKVNPRLAAMLERETNQKVHRWDLIPDDWWWIYPELVGKEGAPQLPEKARSAA